ncbi:hypothetical protein ACHWQZ_G000409 [Mnemiopsis leidyi]
MSEDERQFETLGLKTWLVQQCKGLGMKQPTLVQSNCVPAIMEGKDCIGCAKTGSGKTAAFALPILDKLSDDPYGIFALVLTPTRELAFQIKDQFVALGAHINTRVSVVVGGMDMLTQSIELSRTPHIVIATPGRLADHINSGDGLKLKKVKFLVLDEADRLLEPCFQSDLGAVFAELPKQRQTLLFSATLTETIEQLKSLSSTPPHVYCAPSDVATVETLKQHYMLVPELMRNTALAHTLQTHVQDSTCIVFTHSCKSAQILTIGLKKIGFPCTALHSVMNQNARLSSLAKFKCGVVKILVATDVASRGLDIPTVAYVINYNTPSAPTDYIHRVGRTARAGAGGCAITIITQYDIERLQAIEAAIGTQLQETTMSDEESVKILQPVSLAMREAVLHLDTHGFGENRARNKRKSEKKIEQSSGKKRKKGKIGGEESNEAKTKQAQIQSNVKSDVEKSISRTKSLKKVKTDSVNKRLKKKKKSISGDK